MTLQSSDDAITLILWYRGDTSGVPIYSVDARHGSLENAKHSPMHNVFAGNRATFDLSVRPAILRIDPVIDGDGMEYKCRVDYRYGRTMITYVTLIVIGSDLLIYIFLAANCQVVKIDSFPFLFPLFPLFFSLLSVPPRKIIIKNEKNQPQNGLIGPYNEGSDVRLICISEGGMSCVSN